MVIIVATTTEEIKEAFAWLTENVNAVNLGEIVTEKRPMTGAERTAKWRAGKKAQHGDVTETSQPSQDDKEKREEEREEKEAVSPLVPPSLSPNTLYPIPPIIPPSQEKEEREGERKERGSTKAAKPVKTAYGMFGHVMLTGEEFRKLFQKFGKDCSDRIQRLDDYLENNRKKHYDNHYLTILNWARRDEETQPLMQKPQATFVKPEPKKTYDFTDVLEMRRQKQEQEVIDL